VAPKFPRSLPPRVGVQCGNPRYFRRACLCRFNTLHLSPLLAGNIVVASALHVAVHGFLWATFQGEHERGKRTGAGFSFALVIAVVGAAMVRRPPRARERTRTGTVFVVYTLCAAPPPAVVHPPLPVQGVLQLRLDGWRPRTLSLVLLVASQTVGLAIGVASAFVFDSPGTAAAVTCTYAYFIAIGTVALRWSHGGHRLPPRWRTGKCPRGSFLDVWSPHPLPCPLAGFADPGLPMSDFRRLAAPVCVQARYQDC
jgi:hypothetical protein